MRTKQGLSAQLNTPSCMHLALTRVAYASGGLKARPGHPAALLAQAHLQQAHTAALHSQQVHHSWQSAAQCWFAERQHWVACIAVSSNCI